MAADGETSESDKLSVVLRAGASIVGSKPIISHDTKLVLTFLFRYYYAVLVNRTYLTFCSTAWYRVGDNSRT